MPVSDEGRGTYIQTAGRQQRARSSRKDEGWLLNLPLWALEKLRR